MYSSSRDGRSFVERVGGAVAAEVSRRVCGSVGDKEESEGDGEGEGENTERNGGNVGEGGAVRRGESDGDGEDAGPSGVEKEGEEKRKDDAEFVEVPLTSSEGSDGDAATQSVGLTVKRRRRTPMRKCVVRRLAKESKESKEEAESVVVRRKSTSARSRRKKRTPSRRRGRSPNV